MDFPLWKIEFVTYQSECDTTKKNPLSDKGGNLNIRRSISMHKHAIHLVWILCVIIELWSNNYLLISYFVMILFSVTGA